MAVSYRPEIDGLRTIAVLSVIIYHAEFFVGGFFVLPGGYLGVDIFFVISGYLITSLILTELRDTQHFSVLNFYERRARRLLPALLLVMLVSIVAAWKILLPAQLVDFAHSLLASLFFVSNFYWDLSLQVYGAQPALLKPFLHTWSLAVEEQYYIIFPLLLMAIFRWVRAYLVALLCAGFFASLLFAQWFTSVDANSSFYLLPSRFWELLAGGLLACFVFERSFFHEKTALDTVAPIVGLVLVVTSFFLFDHDTSHPGFITLFPIIGTVLLIAYTGRDDPITRILSSRAFVSIGVISYSLYLWHFPIFAFARNMHAAISVTEKLVWIGLTFVCSILSYRVVEKPFRDRKKMTTRVALVLLAVFSLLVVLFSAYAIQGDGLRQRLSQMELLYGVNEFDNAILEEQTWSVLNRLAAEQGLGPSLPRKASEFESSRLWFSNDPETHKVLVVGVSISRDLFNALYLNRGRFPGTEFARFAMDSRIEPEALESLVATPNFGAADTVVLNFSMNKAHMAQYSRMVERLAATGKQIIITSNPQLYLSRGGKPPFDWHLMQAAESGDTELDFDRIYYDDRLLVGTEADALLREVADAHGLPFLDLRRLVCNEPAQRCEGVTPEGYKAYYDSVHWTLEGAEYFGAKIANDGWFSTP